MRQAGKQMNENQAKDQLNKEACIRLVGLEISDVGTKIGKVMTGRGKDRRRERTGVGKERKASIQYTARRKTWEKEQGRPG
jgi:hypothetical protein